MEQASVRLVDFFFLLVFVCFPARNSPLLASEPQILVSEFSSWRVKSSAHLLGKRWNTRPGLRPVENFASKPQFRGRVSFWQSLHLGGNFKSILLGAFYILVKISPNLGHLSLPFQKKSRECGIKWKCNEHVTRSSGVTPTPTAATFLRCCHLGRKQNSREKSILTGRCCFMRLWGKVSLQKKTTHTHSRANFLSTQDVDLGI